jgi:hypothetical protein
VKTACIGNFLVLTYRINFLLMPFIAGAAMAVSPLDKHGGFVVSPGYILAQICVSLHCLLSLAIPYNRAGRRSHLLPLSLGTACGLLAVIPITGFYYFYFLWILAFPIALGVYPMNAAELFRMYVASRRQQVLGCGSHGAPDVTLPPQAAKIRHTVLVGTCTLLLAGACLFGGLRAVVKQVLESEMDYMQQQGIQVKKQEFQPATEFPRGKLLPVRQKNHSVGL